MCHVSPVTVIFINYLSIIYKPNFKNILLSRIWYMSPGFQCFKITRPSYPGMLTQKSVQISTKSKYTRENHVFRVEHLLQSLKYAILQFSTGAVSYVNNPNYNFVCTTGKFMATKACKTHIYLYLLSTIYLLVLHNMYTFITGHNWQTLWQCQIWSDISG